MKKMNPLELVPVRTPREFNEIYNSNMEVIDEVLDKLIKASNRQNNKIFLMSLGYLGLSLVTYGLLNEVARLKDKIDILTKKNEES